MQISSLRLMRSIRQVHLIYGARPLKRYLQKNVETLAARLILAGNVGREDTILIDAKDGKLKADVKRVNSLERQEA